jgi:predicted NACHT family NTPase
LILLGEPGIGKSTALRDEYDRSIAKSASTGDQVVWVDLRSYQTDQRLHDSVFASPAVRSWVVGSNQLQLFIDSMDEALIRIDNIGPVLLTELKELPISRLNVRIACRTADWPRSLEAELAEVWGRDKVGMYELVPLRRTDVDVAVRENTLYPNSFISEVIRCNAVPLAIKPVTLGFLLNTFKRYGSFPSTQVELYDQGCRLLCEDPRDHLRPAKPASEYTAAQKAAVASRIAVTTILCNRNAVWTDVDRGDVPEEDIPVSDLIGGKAAWQNEKIEVGADSIRQSLNTGLFSSRGPSHLGWAHQTYAEFLAARFLTAGGLTPDRVMCLILHEDGKVVPQLHELAAWLATMVPDLFRRLMKADAEFLLSSDAATTDFRDRQDLVENLLALFDQGELLDFDWDLLRRYRKLRHPNLTQQLQPFIRDKTKGTVVRRVAIHIGEACEVQSLQELLVQVSLDTSDNYEVRVAAAFAIFRLGDKAAKRAMRPLALGTAGPDPHDDLKGCGLECTWPESLSAAELFKALIPEKDNHRIGRYRNFLKPEIAAQVSPSDLPTALTWAAERGGPPDPLNPLTEIADAIAARALDYVDKPEVCGALAHTLRAWTARAFDTSRSEESLFCAKLAQNEERRRQLLIALLPLVADATFELLHMYRGTLVTRQDFFWILHLLRSVRSPGEQRTIVEIVRHMYDYRDVSQTDALLETCRENELLAREFSWLINPVILGSPEAAEMKAAWSRLNDLSSRPEYPLLDPSPDQRIAALLEKFADGDLTAFWLLNRDLTLNPDSTRYGDEHEPDLTALPGWQRADDITRDRIKEAARRYLITCEPPEPATWTKTNTFPFAVLSGYRALFLLLGTQGNYIDGLPKACWMRWAPITLAYPFTGESASAPRHQCLTRLAYEHAPTEVLNALNSLIEKDNEQQHGMLFALQRADPIWDGRIAAALLTKLNDSALKPSILGTILAELLKHKSSEAQAIAKGIVSGPIPPEGEQRTRAIQAAQVLIRNTDDAGWDVVWPAVRSDTSFGVDVFTGIAFPEAFSAASAAKLSDTQLAELYIWIVRRVPYMENDSTTYGLMSPVQSLGHWRDALLAHLKGRGTRQACDGIRQAMVEFPSLTWLRWHLQEAEKITRRRSWTPLHPKEVLAFSTNSDRRLVQHGGQLLELLMESLQRLEEELHGETPAAPALWNEISKNCYQPKEEARLSDHVKLHFERDIRDRGVIVNREVEIRQRMGNNPGEEIDIHVDAISLRPGGKYDRISVIVEVKGCWHKDLMTAMQTQLRDRYLRENRCPFGLYLVGWFVCPQWDTEDYRRGDTPPLSLGDARATFQLQAATLSVDQVQLKAFVLNTALP